MSDSEIALRELFGKSVTTYILCGAIAFFLLFIGLLIFDHFRRQRKYRHMRRYAPAPLTFGAAVKRPFVQAREAFHVLKDAARRSSRRRQRDERIAQRMRRLSK